MTHYETFRQALSEVEGSHWRTFEQLANVFLAAEFPSLRPMAAPGGDEGMDARLFRPVDADDVVLQFSLRKDWSQKIKETCVRLSETTPEIAVLIYATNQVIGSSGNELKKAMRRDYRIFLDIRDQEWFLTHRNANAATQEEADRFVGLFAPGSSLEGSIERQAQALDDLEAKAAFVYLGLQWADDTRAKGLTKVCFDAVVRAVLRDTTSESRMTRQAVRDAAAKLLPAQHVETRDRAVDAALRRLSKVFIRHWTKVDEFCLTWDERKRLADRLTEMDRLNAVLDRQLKEMILRFASEDGFDLSEEAAAESVARSRSVLERVLLDRGEVFAEAVVHDRGASIRYEDVEALVYSDFAANPSKQMVEPRVVASAVINLMADPPDDVKSYLRSLSDTYTLFAFLRETPDVQSAIVKIFSDGDIWLDASVVLPTFAEELLASTSRAHGNLLRAVREAGLRLFVTEGVLQELATHVTRCRGYYHALSRGDAYGAEPFLLSSYRLSGRPLSEFETWLQNFCGSSHHEDDIADYLEEEFRIKVQPLTDLVEKADAELVIQVGEIWHEARDTKDEAREKAGLPKMDAGTRALLVQHDVENYVGVQMRRAARKERRSAFGYKSWLLTLDGTAFRVARELADRMDGKPEDSPAISPDFMLHYLAVGPVRSRLSRRTEDALPLMLNMSILDAVPQELLDLSDALRKELVDLPPRVVRRKIRDTLEEARLLMGARARAGEQGLTDEIKARLIREARDR